MFIKYFWIKKVYNNKNITKNMRIKENINLKYIYIFYLII